MFRTLVFSCYPPTVVVATQMVYTHYQKYAWDVLFQAYHTEPLAKQLLYVLPRIQRVFRTLVFSCYPPTVVVATQMVYTHYQKYAWDVLFQAYHTEPLAKQLLYVLPRIQRVFRTLVFSRYPPTVVVATRMVCTHYQKYAWTFFSKPITQNLLRR